MRFWPEQRMGTNSLALKPFLATGGPGAACKLLVREAEARMDPGHVSFHGVFSSAPSAVRKNALRFTIPALEWLPGHRVVVLTREAESERIHMV